MPSLFVSSQNTILSFFKEQQAILKDAVERTYSLVEMADLTDLITEKKYKNHT